VFIQFSYISLVNQNGYAVTGDNVRNVKTQQAI